MRKLNVWASLWFASGMLLPAPPGFAAQLAGVVVSLEDYAGPARVVGLSVDQHELRIEVDPRTETEALVIRVELPTTGRGAWSVADVEVYGPRGESIFVRRSGLEWHKLQIPVPALESTYFVRVVDPPAGKLRLTAEKERRFADPATGLSVSVARWYDGRQTALTLRFDDSHPTHLIEVMPPASTPASRLGVRDSQGETIRVRSAEVANRTVWRFEVAPRTASFTVELNP